MRQEFEQELKESGYIHRPLPLHRERSLENILAKKRVEKRRVLWEGGRGGAFRCLDQGSMEQAVWEGISVLEMKAPLVCPCWPDSMPQDGDCAYYGRIHGSFSVEREDWREYHRMRILIRPECEGSRSVSLSLYVKNDGEQKVPDRYGREGQHLLNLENHRWNECIWEFPSMPRDQVTEFGFQYRINGKDITGGSHAVFALRAVFLEAVEKPEKEEGWLPKEGKIAYASCGYEPAGDKRAVLCTEENYFVLEKKDETADLRLEMPLEKVHWKGVEYGIADFSRIRETGIYRILCGSLVSAWFPIEEGVWEEIIWKGINFLFCERCGYPVPGKHGLCHMDVYAEHNGVKLPYCGGWHDAGDMSQQTVQTAETTESLLELAEAVEGKTQLYQRLMEEALWGVDFLLRTRFGDGFRAASLGLIRWTDGKIGNEDDASNVRVHAHALENFICAGVLALAGKVLQEYDPELALGCVRAAKEDFEFAMDRWKERGMELPIMWEHTYSSSKALYYGEILLTAVRLWEVTGDSRYKDAASEYAARLCACQKLPEKEEDVSGYFCRDESLSVPVHYSHQSREHIPVKALTLFVKTTCPESESDHAGAGGSAFEAAYRAAFRGISRYAEYLKRLMEYSSPYGMIPAGVYRQDEAEDEETFRLCHLLVKYEEEKDCYREQVKRGIPVGSAKDEYIRQFPVWFSFRGNTAVLLSQASGAAWAGSALEEEKLRGIAGEQIQWLMGKNPFCRSLMYGVGEDYEQLFSVFPGICTGQLPVGIETRGDEDIPYWPQSNHSTYKEVWVTAVSRLFGVMSELLKSYLKYDK